MPYKLKLIHSIILVIIQYLWPLVYRQVIFGHNLFYRLQNYWAPFSILAWEEERKKKAVNPFYSFVIFTFFFISVWSFCDPNGSLWRRFMVFYFSLMPNKIPSVIWCHNLNVRNILVEFTKTVAPLLSQTLGYCRFLYLIFAGYLNISQFFVPFPSVRFLSLL